MAARSAHARFMASALCGLLLGALALLAGCGPRQGDRQGARSEVTAAEWDWLRQTRQRLDEMRGRLAQLEAARLRENAEAGKPPSDELLRLRREVDDLAAELNRRLVEYINANAADAADAANAANTARGETPRERQLAAIRMKSDEDILLAREYIEEAGDYRRAIEICETALAADPENPRLRSELETARARRYVTRQRFALVREGMTQAEVRRLLGPPNLQDIRDYPERGVTAWFYPKDASGAAAAVWFHKDGAAPAAYQLDFDALQPPPAGAPARPRPAPSPPAAPPTPRP